MAESFYALEQALVWLCDESDGPRLGIDECLLLFLNAFCDFPIGSALLERYGNHVARSTGTGTPYHVVWRNGIRHAHRIMPRESGDPRLARICPLRWLRCRKRQATKVGEMTEIRRAITRVLDDYDPPGAVRVAFSAWREQATDIESFALLHNGDACRYFYMMHANRFESQEAIVLRSGFGRFYYEEIRAAGRFLVQQLRANLNTGLGELPQTAPQAITRAQVAKVLGIEPKTLKNRSRELPQPIGTSSRGVPIYSYPELRVAIIAMYPGKAFLFPEDFEAIKGNLE